MVEQSPIMHAMMESAEKSRAELERKEKEAQRLIGARKSQRKPVRQTPGALQSVSGPATGGGRGPSPAAISQVLNRSMTNPTAGPPRPSAADYVPPSSFLQTMTNPKNETVYPQSLPDYFK